MNDKTMSVEEMIESLENQGFVVYTKEDMDSKYNEIRAQGDLIIKLRKDKDKLREKLKKTKAKLRSVEADLAVAELILY